MESSKDRKDQRNLALESVFRASNNQINQNFQRAQTHTATNQEEPKQIPTSNHNPSSHTEEPKTKKNPMAAYKSPQSTLKPETQKARTPIEGAKVATPIIPQNERVVEAKEKSTSSSSRNSVPKIEENKSFGDIKPTDTKDLINCTKITENEVRLIRETNFPVKKSTKNPEANPAQSVQVKDSSKSEAPPIRKSEGEWNDRHEVNKEEMRRIFSSESKASPDRNPITSQTRVEAKTHSKVTGNGLISSEIIQFKDKNQEIKQNNSFQATSTNQVSVNQKPVQIVPPPRPLASNPPPLPLVSNPPPQPEKMHFFAKPAQIVPNPLNKVADDRNIVQNGNVQPQPPLTNNQILQAGQSKDKAPSLNTILGKLKSPSQVPSQQPESQTSTPSSYPSSAFKQQPNSQTSITNQYPSSAPKQQLANQNNLSSPFSASVPKQQELNERNFANSSKASSQHSLDQSNWSYDNPSPAPRQPPEDKSNLVPNQVPSQAKPQSFLQSNVPSAYSSSTLKQQATNQTNAPNPCSSPATKQQEPNQNTFANPSSASSQSSFNQNNRPYDNPSPAPGQLPVNKSNVAPNQLPSQPKPQSFLQSNAPSSYSSSTPKQQAANQNNVLSPALKQIPLSQNNIYNPNPSQTIKAPLSQNNENLNNRNPSPAHMQPISQNNFKNDFYSASKPSSESSSKPNFSSIPRDISPIVYNRDSSPYSYPFDRYSDPFDRYSDPIQDNPWSQIPNGGKPLYQFANNYSQQAQDKKAEIPNACRSANNFDNQRLRDARPPINIPPPPLYSSEISPYDSQTSPYEDPHFISNPFMPNSFPIKRSVNYDELFNYVLDFQFVKAGLDAMDPPEIPSIFNSPHDYEKWLKPAFYEEFDVYLMRAYNEINKAPSITSKLEIHSDYGKIRKSYYEESLQNHDVLIMIPESLIGRSNPLQYMEYKNFYKIGIINKLPPPKGTRIIWNNGRALEPYEEENFRIYTLDKMISSSREFSIFQLFPSFKLQNYVLSPNLAVKEPLSDELLDYIATIHHEFNEFQFDAIREILQVTEGISLLQGPPGTGKTKTIIGILSGFLTKTRLRKFPNILICAPSNIAIDEIGLRIVRDGLFIGGQDPESIMIIRIGKRKHWEGKDNDNEEVDEIKSIRLEFLIEQKLRELNKKDTREDIESVNKQINEFKGLVDFDEDATELNVFIEQLQQELVQLKKQLKDYNDAKKSIRADLVKRANVVLTTLSGAGSEMLKAKTFDYVIIDEACQSIELSSLIPFQYNPKHVVLVGDPNQLPATMLSEKSEKNNFGRSLFERLATNGAEYNFLNTQYRMNQEICAFPSNCFYNSRLVCAPGFFESRPIPEWINPSGIMLFDLASSEERKEDSETSFYNREEAIFIEEIYRYIKTRSSSKNIEIGVITPYAKQTETIQTQLTRFHQKEWEKHIEVGTIDGFQGREKDVIILSLVRTEGIGFLWNKKRINVSLTRSKFGLWVIGKADCLISDETWGAFIQHCQSQQKLVTCYSFNDVAHYFSKESASHVESDYHYD
ncbi:unnamed protein product [Blepharisma stoltei]|uniref:Uncharacterized protein n=1 Tax=Blepharisma stoltei TaxID=1481888 RepID=A0AAU9IPG5_9CILI|nr:unnamed protein product [Blepharisma stoltei]